VPFVEQTDARNCMLDASECRIDSRTFFNNAATSVLNWVNVFCSSAGSLVIGHSQQGSCQPVLRRRERLGRCRRSIFVRKGTPESSSARTAYALWRPNAGAYRVAAAACDVLQDNADGEGYVMNGMLVTASSRRKIRSWRTAPGVRAGAESSRKKRSNRASSIRSKALCVPKMHEGDCTHVIELGCSRYPIGIQFP